MEKKKVRVDKIIKIINRTIEILFTIFIILFCLIVLCQRFFQKENSFLGYRVFTIVTESMKPELEVGDIILVKETQVDEIEIGDNITYQGMSDDLANKIITHQVKNVIVENEKKIFYTQGINSGTMDPAVYESQIYGVVCYKFIVLSLIYKIITNTVGFVLLIVLPLSYIFIMELKTIVVERNNAKEEELRKKEEERRLEELKRQEEKKLKELEKKKDKVKTTTKKSSNSKNTKSKTTTKKSSNKNTKSKTVKKTVK